MNSLLHTPEGVRDIIGYECKSRQEMVNRMWSVIEGYGYTMINTPTFEFIDCYSRDIGSTPANELYKFFDREGNTIALRPDFTPSIARVSAKYFSNSGSLVKLGYAGNVFRNYSSYRGRLNETRQVGAEYIGDQSIEADAEMIAMAVHCIECSNIKDFRISIGHSDIFTGLCGAIGLSEEDTEELKKIVVNKNFFGMEEFLEKQGISKQHMDSFLACMRYSSGEVTLDVLSSMLADIPKVSACISYLKELIELIKIYGVEQYVSLDLSLISEYEYYTGIIFRGYTYGSGNAILSGGRYDNLLSTFGKDAPAIGFAILCDDLMEASKRQGVDDFNYEIRDVILYENNHRVEAIKNANHMRRRGKKVLLIQYCGEEELEKYKNLYKNDNLFLITDGN